MRPAHRRPLPVPFTPIHPTRAICAPTRNRACRPRRSPGRTTMSAATSTAGTAFAAVQKFRLGATVRTDDGELGSRAWVALDPAMNTVTAIGVKLGVFGGTYMAPIDRVVAARQGDIDVSLTRAELAQSKDKPDGAVITRGTAVTLNGSRMGKVA